MAHRKEITYTVDDNGCHNCTSHYINPDGYAVVGWKSKVQRLHRALYESIHGKLPGNTVVRHTCNNRTCINIDHLIEGTQADNVQDSVRAGTHFHPEMKGETSPHAKFKTETAIEIHRLRHEELLSETEITKRIDNIVNRATIGKILRGERWKQVYAACSVCGAK